MRAIIAGLATVISLRREISSRHFIPESKSRKPKIYITAGIQVYNGSSHIRKARRILEAKCLQQLLLSHCEGEEQLRSFERDNNFERNLRSATENRITYLNESLSGIDQVRVIARMVKGFLAGFFHQQPCNFRNPPGEAPLSRQEASRTP